MKELVEDVENEEAQSLVLEGVGNTYNEYLKILDKDEAK